MVKLYVLYNIPLSLKGLDSESYILTIGAPRGCVPTLNEIKLHYSDEHFIFTPYSALIGRINTTRDGYIISQDIHNKYLAARSQNAGLSKTSIDISEEEFDTLKSNLWVRSPGRPVIRKGNTFTDELEATNRQALDEAQEDLDASKKKTFEH